MSSLLRIFRYTLFDLIRSRWAVFYLLFFLVGSYVLFSFSQDVNQTVVSLLNMVLLIIPLISLILGTIYFYNIREFIDLLLSQPVKRRHVFLGIYLGLGITLSVTFLIGTVSGLLFTGMLGNSSINALIMLVIAGFVLTFIFIGFALWISIVTQNKIKGITFSVFLWLFCALLYDGIFLLWLILFDNYPVEKHALVLSMLNPIDLARIMVLLKLDISALMGYTGAVFNKLLGNHRGMLLSGAVLILWVIIPLMGMLNAGRRKDF